MTSLITKTLTKTKTTKSPENESVNVIFGLLLGHPTQ